VKLLQGDCLELMKDIPDQSVDLILCDLPYGTTACKWDTIIPFDFLWEQYLRIAKDKAAIIITSSQPFTSTLICSNIKHFRYSLVWDKVNKYTGALNANRMPLRRHEDISIFYKKSYTKYNKQFRDGKSYKTSCGGHGKHTRYHNRNEARYSINEGKHNPCSIVEIPADNKLELGLHPTQKPVALMEYLIKTYTNEEDIVLDNCMGSGTTGIACLNLNRQFIGIEKDETYFKIAEDRIWKHCEKLCEE
jgi:site-specific DNA-methyltransferase (adenine-specific)